MRLFVLYGHDFGERVIGNMVNLPEFCKACDLACANCRALYSCFASDVCGAFRVPTELPAVIDDPERFLPGVLPRTDVLLAIGLHPDLLVTLPSLAKAAGAKAAIVPIEDPKWCPPSLKSELLQRFDSLGIEGAFPKPFCDLDPVAQGPVEAFMLRYQIGKPVIEVSVLKGRISDTRVLRSAPCGSTWYVAQQIKWAAVEDPESLENTISKAHHGYPCTASMELDAELGDTILHKSGYIIRDAVEQALVKAERTPRPNKFGVLLADQGQPQAAPKSYVVV